MSALRPYSIEIEGREKRWSFDVWATQDQVEEWRSDGLSVSEVVEVQWISDREEARIRRRAQ